ncbi:lipid droplet-associated hydrolase-like [Clavelina lepadiformis]|uniref:lipid droplet-associated hydrolase-like n=1 Tax=Clavelina lepadiformis TaxID=159417 RepID=UPI004040F51B
MAARFKSFWTLQSGIAINHMKFDDISTAEKCEKRHPIVFVIIPGNPGLIHFYEKFSEVLYSTTDIPVWGVSHTGHTKTDKQFDHPDVLDCGLECQIEHKIDFLKQEVFPNADKVILIGHSIGCYIILQIMDKMKEYRSRFEKGVLLFPTIERMRHTPNGKLMTPILSYGRWLYVFLAGIFNLLPNFVLCRLVPCLTSSERCVSDTVLEHLCPKVADCCTYMALEEMYEVNKRDDEIIKRNIDKLIFYYGAADRWCPASCYHDLKNLFKHRPNCAIHLCEQNVQHAFMLEHSAFIADLVAKWVFPVVVN